MNRITKFLDEMPAFTVFFFAVNGLRTALEITLYNQIRPSTEDTIIGVILACSLTANLRHWRRWRL